MLINKLNIYFLWRQSACVCTLPNCLQTHCLHGGFALVNFKGSSGQLKLVSHNPLPPSIVFFIQEDKLSSAVALDMARYGARLT